MVKRLTPAVRHHLFLPIVGSQFHGAGYGRTSPVPVNYTDDRRPFGTVNKIKDMLALVSAVGYRSMAAVIGHDAGSPLSGCSRSRRTS